MDTQSNMTCLTDEYEVDFHRPPVLLLLNLCISADFLMTKYTRKTIFLFSLLYGVQVYVYLARYAQREFKLKLRSRKSVTLHALKNVKTEHFKKN